MEFQEETMMGSSNNNDLAYIAKGKRTKRQRPQSPIVLGAMTSSSSSSGSAGGGGGGGGNNIDHHHHQHQQNYSFSPTSSIGFMESTEEEEDMANCLILLAKGGHENSRRIEEITGTHVNNSNNVERFTSRRFTEGAAAATTTNGKQTTGFYVYECKTCNRCFPSFQALGGHRASHKKPKNMIDHHHHQKIKPLPPLVLSSSEDDQTQTQNQILPIQISSSTNIRTAGSINNNKSKVHECSICGSEFSSGQALGGHMRRHRTAPSTTTATATATSATMINPPSVTVTYDDQSDNHQEQQQPKKTRNLLSLDLNLPAPSEDDRAEGKFSFGSKQSLVFSASALVDCHY